MSLSQEPAFVVQQKIRQRKTKDMMHQLKTGELLFHFRKAGRPTPVASKPPSAARTCPVI